MANIDDDDDESGTGGAAGEVHFRYKDILSSEPREDQLSPSKTKHLLSVLEDLHKDKVKRQQIVREDRKKAKSGRVMTQGERYQANLARGMKGGSSSEFKTHPLLATKPNLTDPQVNTLPTENVSETNLEMREELQNRHQLRLMNAPKFNPKPRPY